MLRLIPAIMVVLLTNSAFSQQQADIIRLDVPQDGQLYLESLLSSECRSIVGEENRVDNLSVQVNSLGEYRFNASSVQTESTRVSLSIHVNEWRRLHPDSFVPGPVNGVLGAVGLADARTIFLIVEEGKLGPELIASWNRRKDDGSDHRVVVASCTLHDSNSGIERWEFKGIGFDWYMRAAARIWYEIDDSDPTRTKWQLYDRYIRARSTLVASLARATERISLCITPELEYALVIQFEAVIKPDSVRRAVDRFIGNGENWNTDEQWAWRLLPSITLDHAELRPEIRVGIVDSKPAIVLAIRPEHSMAVADALNHK
jgi:hypothetical protein